MPSQFSVSFLRRLAASSAVALALGCEHGEDHAHGHEHPAAPAQDGPKDEQAAHEHGEHEHGAPAAAAPRLDDGKRWKANAETTAGVARMLDVVKAALGAERAATEGMRASGAQLRRAYGDIFAQCTMEGDAHAQLHTFLLPLGPLISDVESGDPKRGAEALRASQKHLEGYATFFE